MGHREQLCLSRRNGNNVVAASGGEGRDETKYRPQDVLRDRGGIGWHALLGNCMKAFLLIFLFFSPPPPHLFLLARDVTRLEKSLLHQPGDNRPSIA